MVKAKIVVDFTEEEMDILQQACRILGKTEAELRNMKSNGYCPLTDDVEYPKILDAFGRKLTHICEWLSED